LKGKENHNVVLDCSVSTGNLYKYEIYIHFVDLELLFPSLSSLDFFSCSLLQMSLPKFQEAAIVLEQRGLSIIQKRVIPVPAKGQILVRVLAAAVNPVDSTIRDHKLVVAKYPVILGSDGAGEVVSVGGGDEGDARSFKIGDRVFFQGIYTSLDFAAFQQYSLVHTDLAGRTPSQISDEEASTLNVCGLAAAIGLYHPTSRSTIRPFPWQKDGSNAGKGQAIIILGGSSNVGLFVIQLARISGFTKIVTSSSLHHRDYLLKLGATHVLDRTNSRSTDFAETVQDLPLNTIYDAISNAETQFLAVKIFQARYANPEEGGERNIIVTTAVNAEAKAESQVEGKLPITLTAILAAGALPHLRPFAREFIEALGGEKGWIAKKIIIPSRIQLVPGGLESVNLAMKLVEDGVSRVKVVVKPQDAE
jgi:NADPH:quinone reductase-like Zn-dependent oxidoreductase